MNPEELLGTTFECECGCRHTVPVKTIIYQGDALEVLPDVLDGFVSSRSILIVSDVRTFAVAGEKASSYLKQGGWKVHEMIIPDGDKGSPVCDDITYNNIKETAPRTDVFLAVGCGVINDLTKWLAFERDIPYAVVPTAASMNGFTAANIAPMLRGVKSLIPGGTPIAVFAVPSIIIDAPYELTSAGLGDCLAKPISTADWLMNHIFLDEYFCDYCSRMINDLETVYLGNPENIYSRDPAAISALFSALLYSGIAMTIVGTSAPASGGEHLLSHTLDMMSALEGEPHDLHGRQVGLGALFASALYEKILKIERPTCREMPPDVDEPFWGDFTPNVRQQYLDKRPLLQSLSEKLSNAQNWRNFCEQAALQVRSPKVIKECLKAAGGAHKFSDINCSRKRFLDAVLHMHEIRKRPTIIDLGWMLGLLPETAEEIVDQWFT
jgi:glycerol-1-phosphate dehydrogenase [NAD(P)+]